VGCDRRAYVGASESPAERIRAGHVCEADRVAVITDADGKLDARQAQVLERIVHGLVAHAGGFERLNPLPVGAPTDPEEYTELRRFATDGMLMLREAGVLFTRASIRKLVSGPRTMGDTPVMSLDFDDGQLLEVRRRGLVARAIERRDGSWMLLRGSMLSRHIARPAAPRRPSGEWSGSIPAY
jgi:hypothetical protein